MVPSSRTAYSTQITELITGPLKLAITRAGTNVVLSWSGSVAGYQLQSTPSLAPATWTGAGSATLANNSYSLTLPASATRTFFRLKK